ncbi:DinB family protein [Flavobacterium sp.]|uniref:DinB family protein n=1 Tax=Flavobacterium sp. TaxID=239 RepID=UPI0028BD9CBE|nr:DinB family protein [Flavobacterium sp.]
MQVSFDINQSSRNILLKFLDNYSTEQLNKIPEGYSNNLIWNIGHIVVVQQMLVYNLSGLPMMVSAEMVEKYKKGTKPEATISEEEIAQIKSLLFSTLEQTKKDFSEGNFKNYSAFTTMTGFNIRNAQEAMEFNNYHEGVHTGIMMRISKFL